MLKKLNIRKNYKKYDLLKICYILLVLFLYLYIKNINQYY